MSNPNYCPNCGGVIFIENITAIKQFSDMSVSLGINGWYTECKECKWSGVVFPADETDESIDAIIHRKEAVLKQVSKPHLYEQYQTHPLWAIVDKEIDELVKKTDIIEQTRREMIVGPLCKAILTNKSIMILED